LRRFGLAVRPATGATFSSARSGVRVWLDLANSPHVLLLTPIIDRLRAEGDEVLLSARDHAQTVELARDRWPDVEIIGDPSPPGVLAKGRRIVSRAAALRRFAARRDAEVAFSHGSYAQLIAAATSRIGSATMMDYEHQPANHVSFRLARRVIVPDSFPATALRRCGAGAGKVVRYPGFKEELYLGDVRPDARMLDELGVDPNLVLAVFRPPPDGALYHRLANDRFEELLASARRTPEVETIVLPRGPQQRRRYRGLPGVKIPDRAVDSLALLALADLTIGGGGTMTRESALLGTPTYTVFAGRPAAVDEALIRQGRLVDARPRGVHPPFQKRSPAVPSGTAGHGEVILQTVIEAIRAVAAPDRGGELGVTSRR
jgi:predicted glycosyltransferase